MIKLNKELSYTLRTIGQSHEFDVISEMEFCCDIMTETLRRSSFKVERDDNKTPDISLLKQEILGIKYCPWCAAKVVRYYEIRKH